MRNFDSLQLVKKALVTLCILSSTLTNGQDAKWTSIVEANSWLNSNLSEIRQDTKTYEQEIKINKDNYNYLTLTTKETDSKGSSTSSYELYLSHLDESKTTFEVKGTQINVLLYAKNENKVIKHKSEGLFKNYQDEFEIKCDDPQLAKDIVNAVNFLINQSPDNTQKFDTQSDAINWLTTNIGNVKIEGENIDQKFEFFPEQRNKLILTITETNSKGQSTTEYTFYASDFNRNSGELSVSGEKLKLKFTTTDNQLMVKIYKDGKQQKFNKSIELYSSDSKIALDLLSAFQYAFGKTNESISENNNTTSSSVIPVKITQQDVVTESNIPEPEFTARPYYYADGMLKDMERADATLDIKVKGMGYGGASYFYTAFTAQSDVRFSNQSIPKIFIKLEGNIDPEELLVIIKESLNSKKNDRRRFELGSMGMAGKARDVSENEVDFSINRVRQNLYEIIFDNMLEPGEYAIMPVSDANTNLLTAGSTKVKITCFGIE